MSLQVMVVVVQLINQLRCTWAGGIWDFSFQITQANNKKHLHSNNKLNIVLYTHCFTTTMNYKTFILYVMVQFQCTITTLKGTSLFIEYIALYESLLHTNIIYYKRTFM